MRSKQKIYKLVTRTYQIKVVQAGHPQCARQKLESVDGKRRVLLVELGKDPVCRPLVRVHLTADVGKLRDDLNSTSAAADNGNALVLEIDLVIPLGRVPGRALERAHSLEVLLCRDLGPAQSARACNHKVGQRLLDAAVRCRASNHTPHLNVVFPREARDLHLVADLGGDCTRRVSGSRMRTRTVVLARHTRKVLPDLLLRREQLAVVRVELKREDVVVRRDVARAPFGELGVRKSPQAQVRVRIPGYVLENQVPPSWGFFS